jgi:hypothetical protein
MEWLFTVQSVRRSLEPERYTFVPLLRSVARKTGAACFEERPEISIGLLQ